MRLSPLATDLQTYLRERKLVRKYDKVSKLFESNIRHPSLNTELLEPHWRGVYSFRIDRKYRALFLLISQDEAEVIAVTNHYK